MSIEWRQQSGAPQYWHGMTPSRFSFQIGVSTNRGRYVALVFHADFRYKDSRLPR